jgi:hypothetical protein
VWLAFLAAGLSCAASDWDGRLALVLEQAVCLTGQGSRGQERPDLRVDLVCRGGRWEPDGWAWFDRLPAVEHPVIVTAQTNDTGIRFDLTVKFHSFPPVFAGGVGTYAVRLERTLDVIRGEFRGECTNLSAAASADLWQRYRGRLLGATQKPDWDLALDVGRPTSVRRPAWGFPIQARAVILPLRSGGGGGAPASSAGSGPRLVSVSERSAGKAVSLLAQLESSLRAEPGAWSRCAGAMAAGWGFLALVRRDAAAVNESVTSARLALDAIRARPHAMVYGRHLAGLAVAYDLGRASWPLDLRVTARGELARSGLRIAGCLPVVTKADGLLEDDQLLGRLAGPYDYRLAYLRAAAGLALLAVEGEIPPGDPEATPERLAWADAVVARSVERFLATGIGERGAGSGQNGFADLIETLFPYLHAYRTRRGIDLAAGTGAAWVAPMGCYTRGRAFARGSDFAAGYWLPLTLPFCDAAFRPAAYQYARDVGCRTDDPYQAALAVANWMDPADVGQASGAESLPVFEDRAMGVYVLRGGWSDQAFLTLFTGGAGPREAAALRGDFAIAGLGRDWVWPRGTLPGDFSWPRRLDCSAIQLERDGGGGRRVAVVPRSAGYVEPVHILRDGSGSLCMRADGQEPFSRRPDRSFDAFGIEDGPSVGGTAWRTLAVDYSGASGADVLCVIAEGDVAGEGVDRYWELDVGPVPPEHVAIGPGSVLVRPPGTDATMKLTFLYPVLPAIGYRDPIGDRGGRVRASLNPRTVNRDLSLDHSIQVKAFGPDVEADLRTVEEVRRDEKSEAAWRRQEAAMADFIQRRTSANGGVAQSVRVAGTCVVALTIQRAAPPEIVPPTDSGADFLFQAGGQTVRFDGAVATFDAVRQREHADAKR